LRPSLLIEYTLLIKKNIHVDEKIHSYSRSDIDE
jgi:hypothetical protein